MGLSGVGDSCLVSAEETVGRITYIVLAQTLNHAQPTNQLKKNAYRTDCIANNVDSPKKLWRSQ